WFDRSGRQERVLAEPANHIDVALSPDGRHVMLETQLQPNADLWIYDAATGARRRITSTPTDETIPVWSPDGMRIAYSGQPRKAGLAPPHYRIEIMRSDGVGGPTVAHADSSLDVGPLSWSPDGRALLVTKGQFSAV